MVVKKSGKNPSLPTKSRRKGRKEGGERKEVLSYVGEKVSVVRADEEKRIRCLL